MQKFTSKKTSIATINRVYKDLPNGNGLILDYGCGAYNLNKELAEEKGYTWYGYDKYNRNEEENIKSIEIAYNNHIDYLICSNVLNVIEEDYIIEEIMINLYHIADNDTIIKITIYEGSKDGIGKETSKGYQRNKKAIEYEKFFKKFNTTKKGNIWTLTK